MKTSTERKHRPATQISWEQILANLDEGVITVDLEDRIGYFNEAAEVLTETSSSAAAGQRFDQLFKREPWLIELLKKSLPPRQESARGEGDFVTRWGRKTPVSVTVSPLQDRHGQFLGSIMLLRDIKHRRELEEDLKRADRLALMGTLAAGLAHEIRNPLGGIKGAAQLLRRTVDGNATVKDFTDIMIREVDRVNQLIEQLLDLSRPAELDLAPVNIHEVLDGVLLLEGQTISDREILIKKRFDPSLPPVRADRAQLTQVFLNLVKNAFQAMLHSGTLTVATRLETDFRIRGQGSESNRFIWVDIADEGAGIREEDLAHIFSPFFTTKTNGTGLGLATCYRIIKEHGGTIRVESIEGKGSTFRVSLMVAD
ncbi:MAG TPA: ATP-binding protein [Acidobacteriota bacterium]|nr:ATP-binding protein [Acidobacteriota bacterium]